MHDAATQLVPGAGPAADRAIAEASLAAALARPDALPESLSEAVFREPWAGRAFAVTLALAEAGLFTLKDFQAALIATVGAYEKAGCITDDTAYYTRWVEALTALLRHRGILADDALASLETSLTAEALARREHQHAVSRNPDGSLRVQPLVVA